MFLDRYAIHDKETFYEACERVAFHIASAEEGSKRDAICDKFLQILSTNRFVAGGRIWRGSSRARGQLLNCFVVPAEDSREGWGKALSDVTVISGTGGGVGLNFSKIRPRGTKIRGTGGEATGSVSLMKCINAVCNELREGGGRRSALMFCLNWNHPDIPEFLQVKLDKNELNNANISICVDKEFFKLLAEDGEIVYKWQGIETGTRMKAKDLWDKIVENSWKSGDPGILNIGYANEMNTIDYITDMSSTNPCGEIWLSEYDCCCLGAINLSVHVQNGSMDWDALDETIALGVRFLDNVLDQNHYPLPEIQATCENHRRIGLGVMGLHDMLLKMGYRYSSQDGRDFVDKLMDTIKKTAYHTSIDLAIEKGPFHECKPEEHVKSGFAKKNLPTGIKRRIKQYGIRNCALLCIAPTGTTSIIAGTSSGIEPIFSLIYKRNFNKHKDTHNDQAKLASNMVVVHPLYREFLLEQKNADHFESSYDITPEEHLAMQTVCQKHVDNAISKTINLPEDYSAEQLSESMINNIQTLKGITVYRDGSKGKSPLVPMSKEEAIKYIDNATIEASVNDCPNGKCEIS